MGGSLVSLAEISAVDGLNAELRSLGLPVAAVPAEEGCAEQQPTDVSATFFDAARVTTREIEGNQAVVFSPEGIPAGATGILTAQQLPDGAVILIFGLVSGPIPACVPPIVVQIPTPDPSFAAVTRSSG